MPNNNIKYIAFIALLYIVPLVLINADYYDDMNRSLTGYNWSQDGRFISSFIMSIISFGSILLPMPFIVKIISAALILLGGHLIGTILFDSNRFLGLFFGLIALTSPFYIENLSYTYDTIPMAVSIVAAIAPFIFYRKAMFIPSSLVCLIVVMGTYQASLIIYPAMTICLVLKSYLEKRSLSVLTFSITPIIVLIVSYAVYFLIINAMSIVPDRAGFIELGSNTLPLLNERMKLYEHMFSSLMHSRYNIPASLFSAVFIAISTYYVIRYKSQGAIDFILMALCTLLIFSFMFIPNIILKTMFMTPRTMIAYPFIALPSMVLFNRIGGFSLKLLNIGLSLFIFYSFMLVNVYSRSIKENIEITNFIGDSIYRDISMQSNGEFTVSVHGEITPSDRSKFLYRELPFLRYISPIYAKQGSYWANLALFRFKRVYTNGSASMSMPSCDDSYINRSGFYTIFKDGNKFDVFLNSTCRNK